MGLFDFFKAKGKSLPEPQLSRLENYPEMLVVKLLFEKPPIIDQGKILTELKQYFDQVENNVGVDRVKGLIFSFPNIRLDLVDTNIPALCTILAPHEEEHYNLEIPENAFQQNWHWREASEETKKCKYELLVTDLMTRTLDYKRRFEMYMNFLVAVTKALNPDVVYSVCGQKLIKPEKLIEEWGLEGYFPLDCICNVRLYNITGTGHRDLLMDTVGLNALGLPDFQIRASNLESNEMARLLRGYAYYIYDKGDIIETGNTLEGNVSGSKWKCVRELSSLQPERMIINVLPN